MIPDYQTLMLPLLKALSDREMHSKPELVNILGKEFNLSEDELQKVMSNSKNGRRIFNNRIHWAQAHLKMAGLIEYAGKEQIKLTERGKQFIVENHPLVNIQYLRSRFPDYNEKFRSSQQELKDELNNTFENLNNTPEELVDINYQKIKIALQQEILSKLKTVHPSFFERIVVELLVKMGYGGSVQDAGKAIGKSGDEGIDGIIKEDKLGLDVIYVQAKRWEGVVGRPELHKFVGALAGQGAKKGIFITTSYFSKDAIAYVPRNETKIVLIDGEKLAQCMIDHNLGVSVQNTYEIKRIDSGYFEED